MRLNCLKNERKIHRLIKTVDDNERLTKLIKKDDVPGLHRQLVVHCCNGGGIESFIGKCERVVELRRAGDASLRQGYVQRGTITDSKLDSETFQSGSLLC